MTLADLTERTSAEAAMSERNFYMLPEDLVLAVAQWLTPRGLLNLCASSKRMAMLPTQEIWHKLCVSRCEAFPRYRLTQEREAWLQAHLPTANARGWYQYMEQELNRSQISQEELEGLTWHFNFTPNAGGRGRRTLARARFSHTHIYLPSFPPLPYMLHTPEVPSQPNASTPSGNEDGEITTSAGEHSATSTSRRALSAMRNLLSSLLPDAASPQVDVGPPTQCVMVANFPPHWVRFAA